ncbi:MAG: hypothetical protein DRZ90_03905 [Spirochaetes bacterium]|nr:MAG: hypothetical protein DRZ90_03905 [Spirochaetota bacterium]
MSDSIVPESRIFRIGRECYVVYLGKERDDFRPFLRIGNARDIPDEVHEVLSTTVVTDDHVGNPLVEILLAPKFQGRYLGDTGVVATIRRFFKSFDLSTDDVTDYRKVKDGERRHMVWFYSSGNIHLRYDERVIFDLDKREKEDRHFVRLFEEAKSEFLRNPLRYIRQDFSGQGVVLADGNVFWYEAGELLSFAAHPGFVARLMGDGVDPDFITASAYNLSSDQMDSRDAAVFIGFVKRVRQRKKQLRVISSQPELLRKLKLLFPERGDSPATLDVTDVSGKRKATFRDSIVSRKDDKWRLHRAGLPEMAFGSELENGISIDFVNGRISFNSESVQAVFVPPAGFPIDFIGHEAPENQMMDKYVAYTFTNIKDHLSDSEVQAVTALERYMKMLRDDISAKKTSVSPLLKQIGGNGRDALRHCRPNQGGPSWFIFSNVAAILGILIKRIGAEHGLYKSADQMFSALDVLMEKMSSPDPVLPFWGDLFLGEEPCLLWRASKRGFVPADIVSARDTNQNIIDITNLDESPWKEDRERLLRLIISLGQGGQGPLTDEQLAILSQPEKNTEKAEEKDQKKTESTEQRKLRTQEISAGSVSPGESRTDKNSAAGKSGSRRRIWPWILLLLLLFFGGALFWDLSGNAPWGSVLSSKSDRAVAADTENQSGNTGVESNGSVNSDTSAAVNSESGSSKTGVAVTGGNETGKNTAGNTETDEAGNQDVVTPGETGNQGVAVDSDVAPKSLDEVKAYLEVDGRVTITEVDIHLAANEIAVLNGYKDLDYRVFTGKDPNWIYPGRTLHMPGTGDYTIKRGDTIWFLAAREVRVDAEINMKLYDNSVSILDNELSDASKKKDAADNLRKIADVARAAALRIMAGNALSSRDL